MGQKKDIQLRVECHSGYQADERPLRFFIKDREFQVLEVLDRWYEPQDTYFKVKADDGGFYILRHCHEGQKDWWRLEAYNPNP